MVSYQLYNQQVVYGVYMTDEGFEARRKAENQRASGNVDGAINTLIDYLEGHPEDHKTRLLLANMLIINKKQKDAGLAHLDTILAMDPEFDDARRALVTVLKENKKFNDETKGHFEYLLKKYPDDVDLLHSYGIFCREQLLDFTRAEKCFKKCVELEPGMERFRLSYASLLINDFRFYDSGRKQLEAAQKINPSNEKTQAALRRLSKKKYQGDKGPRKSITSFFTR